MGLYDLPAPLFEQIDGWMSAWLGPVPRICLWALVVSVVSMTLYRVCSRQRLIHALQQQAKTARSSLFRYEGNFEGLKPLIRDCLIAPLRLIRVVLGPTLIASTPVICVAVWMSTAYGHVFPHPGDSIRLHMQPPTDIRAPDGATRIGTPGGWDIPWPPDGRSQVVLGLDGVVLFSLPTPVPVGVLHKRKWWNWIVANPAGYLPPETTIEQILMALPRRQVLTFGPSWARSWEWPFFALMIFSCLVIKKLLRIH